MIEEHERERKGILRGHGIDRFEGISPGDLFDELYNPRSDAHLAANPERIAMIRDMARWLSIEAREVLLIVVDVPAELAEHIRNSGAAGMSRHIIEEYLRYCGWSFPTIRKTFSEIGNFLKKF